MNMSPGGKCDASEDTVHQAECQDTISNTGNVKVVHNEIISLVSLYEDPVLSETRRRGWYLASRCTVHVCNSRDMFLDYQPWTGHEVVLGNNKHVEVAGIGSVVLQCTTGHVLTLSDVFHIPVIHKCIVAVGKLDGIKMSFSAEGAVIEKNDEIVGIGFIEAGLVRLSLVEEGSNGIQG